MEGRFHQAVEDWFNYRGRTFDVKCYEYYSKEHKTWGSASSTKEIEHQLSHPKSKGECEHCRSWPVPEEPKRCDFFPEEPSTYLLSEGLARVAGVSHCLLRERERVVCHAS